VKIQLIRPKKTNESRRESPSVRQLSVATAVVEACMDDTVELFDGNVHSEEVIHKSISNGIVAIGIKAGDYYNAKKIALTARNRNAVVVYYGIHATILGKQLLRTDDFVDAVAVGDAEPPLSELAIARGRCHQSIPNLIYREKERIVETHRITNDLEEYFPLKYGLIDYWPRNVTYGGQKYETVVCFRSQRGCTWQAKGTGCLFCPAAESGWRGVRPDFFWMEINRICSKYGSDVLIKDMCDDFVASKSWLKGIWQSRRKSLGADLFVQTRADRLDKFTIKKLSDIGVRMVCLGIESADDTLLARINKGMTVEQYRTALQLLSEQQIKTRISVVLGHPGEDLSSLRRTVAFLKEQLENDRVCEIGVNVFKPLPGSRAFDILMEDEDLNEKFDTELPSLEQLERDWVRYHCRVSYCDVLDAKTEIQELIKGTEIGI